ncbi:vomeronasal 1 receptor cavPorV1R666 [Cavia porcellus]|uniref:vomeronasal 1 receptor cavPorV1R666 n=1 Tax=Cavia porcellus TaxID=10141 RepID=UPI0001CF73EA|nr:vomeronasal 1 receptor cavPorV1R666 [Cavia porcellus]
MRAMVLDLVKGTILAFLAGLGTAGNIFVFVNHILMLRGTEKKVVHLILIHLAFANIIMLLSKGMPRTMADVGVRNFLDDTSCKIVCYLERVARSLSICTSGLLTVVQAVTMSPRSSRWRRLRPRSAWLVLSLFPFLWIFSFLTNISLLLYITSTSVNTSQMSESDYCYFRPKNQKVRWIILSSMVLRDAVFQGLTCGPSAYLVLLLRRHHQHVLHLQSSKFLYKTPTEVRAARSVLLLMLCFLFFYWADCVFALLVNSFLKSNPMLNIREFLTLGYAILSPFVLIHRDGHVEDCWPSRWESRTCRKYLFPASFKVSKFEITLTFIVLYVVKTQMRVAHLRQKYK